MAVTDQTMSVRVAVRARLHTKRAMLGSQLIVT